jgi:hypothetical protein
LVRWIDEFHIYFAAKRLRGSFGGERAAPGDRIDLAGSSFDHSGIHLFDPCGANQSPNDDRCGAWVCDQHIRLVEAEVFEVTTRGAVESPTGHSQAAAVREDSDRTRGHNAIAHCLGEPPSSPLARLVLVDLQALIC